MERLHHLVHVHAHVRTTACARGAPAPRPAEQMLRGDQLMIGGGPISGVTQEMANACVRRALEWGVREFDTAAACKY